MGREKLKMGGWKKKNLTENAKLVSGKEMVNKDDTGTCFVLCNLAVMPSSMTATEQTDEHGSPQMQHR